MSVFRTVYVSLEILLAVEITVTNIFIMWAYYRYRQLRTITNTYIFALAFVDFLFGSVGIPLTVYSVLTERPSSYYGCLTVHLSVMILCTVSIFHLLVITVDKYLSINCRSQMWKHRHRHRRATILICWAWVTGTIIGCLPFFTFDDLQAQFEDKCHFMAVIELTYLVYVIFYGTIIFPTIVILFCYLSIYHKLRIESAMVRSLLHRCARVRRNGQNRAVLRSLVVIVITFVICWYPLYTVNAILYYCPDCVDVLGPTVIQSLVILSHMSCALNPMIYAFGLPGFRQVFYGFVPPCCVNRGENINNYNFTMAGINAFGFDTMMHSIRRSVPNALSVKAGVSRRRPFKSTVINGLAAPERDPSARAYSAPNLKAIDSSGARSMSEATIEIYRECVQL